MGIPSKRRIEDRELGFICHKCHSHLARSCDAIRGEFYGELGPAVFIGNVINIDHAPCKTQIMRSGKYIVRYVSCRFCHSYLGWNYVRSFSRDSSYKEGKFCLEVKQIEQIQRLPGLFLTEII